MQAHRHRERERVTERERERGEWGIKSRQRQVPIACGCSDIYMQNRKTNFGCGKMHFANLAAWQTDELELATHTHTHTEWQLLLFYMQLQSQQLWPTGCFSFFSRFKYFRTSLAKHLAGNLPSLLGVASRFLPDIVIACRTKPACIKWLNSRSLID